MDFFNHLTNQTEELNQGIPVARMNSPEENAAIALADFLSQLAGDASVPSLQKSFQKMEDSMKFLPENRSWRKAFQPRLPFWRQILWDRTGISSETEPALRKLILKEAPWKALENPPGKESAGETDKMETSSSESSVAAGEEKEEKNFEKESVSSGQNLKAGEEKPTETDSDEEKNKEETPVFPKVEKTDNDPGTVGNGLLPGASEEQIEMPEVAASQGNTEMTSTDSSDGKNSAAVSKEAGASFPEENVVETTEQKSSETEEYHIIPSSSRSVPADGISDSGENTDTALPVLPKTKESAEFSAEPSILSDSLLLPVEENHFSKSAERTESVSSSALSDGSANPPKNPELNPSIAPVEPVDPPAET